MKINEGLAEQLEKPSPRRLMPRADKAVIDSALELEQARKSIERYATFQSKMETMTKEETHAVRVLRHIVCQMPSIQLPNGVLRRILVEMKLPPEPDEPTKLKNRVFNPIVERVMKILREWAEFTPTPSIRQLIKRKKKRKAQSDDESEYEYEEICVPSGSVLKISPKTGSNNKAVLTTLSTTTAATTTNAVEAVHSAGV